MSKPVSDVIVKIQRRFPDIKDDIALEYINQVHANVLRQLPFVTAVEDLTLVSGTQEYAVNENTIRIVSAEYFTSATGRRPLFATDIDYLNSEEPGWRSMSSGTPHRFYFWRSTGGDGVVGLLPKPLTATASGYPIVRLYVTRVEELTGNSHLPKGILANDVYVYGAQKRFAMDNRAYADEVERLAAFEADAIDLERKAFDERHPYRRRIGVHGIGMGSVS